MIQHIHEVSPQVPRANKVSVQPTGLFFYSALHTPALTKSYSSSYVHFPRKKSESVLVRVCSPVCADVSACITAELRAPTQVTFFGPDVRTHAGIGALRRARWRAEKFLTRHVETEWHAAG